jgi:methylenetetrahydrofolate reductase (NADPH)
MAELSGTPIPQSIKKAFEAIGENPDDVRKLGVEIATELSEKLLAAGAPGLHFYTMNTSTATREIFENLQRG